MSCAWCANQSKKIAVQTWRLRIIPSAMRIHPVDLAIVVVYLLGVTALGMHFRRRSQDARDYFLGGRTAPWWALAFSIVASETSTLTIKIIARVLRPAPK